MALFLYAFPATFSSRLPEKPRAVRSSTNYRHQVVCQNSVPVFVPSQHEKSTVVRRASNFHPTLWDDLFIESLTSYDTISISSITQRIDELKENVQYMLSHENNPLQMMNLVDAIERLGLGYHFEKEIQLTLRQLYENCDIGDSLHAVALRFRLLRQEGYNVPCDVFDKFKDKDRKFKKNLSDDVRGLLSLYEASHLSIHGEDILDEALTFTIKHLKANYTCLDPSLARHVDHALGLPLRKSVPILEIKRFISFYEKEDVSNSVLLKLAKLDFNLHQSYNRMEIKEVAKWRKDMDFTGKLPFARDRLVELYIWSMQMNFLPQFSQGRMALAKFINILPLLDETYEVYGTLDELQLFTDAIARWDLTAMDQLPYYMKLCYLAIYNLFNEIEYISLKDRGSFSNYYLRKSIEDLCTSYMQEARWFHDGYVPRMEEYLGVSTITTTGFILMIIAALGMKELITNEVLDYMFEGSKLPWLLNLICRYTDDLAPSEDEREQGDVAKSVQCYMKEHSVSEEVAKKNIKNLIAETWKEINEELLRPSPLPKPLIKGMLNFARLCETFFENGNDGLGDSKSWSIDLINLLLFEPIPL